MHRLGAAEIAALVRSKELSRREVVEAHAARIGELNEGVNALVDLRVEAALEEAAAADARPPGGPLDGVPVSIKENFDVAGMPSTAGIPSRAELVPERDELGVRRLREAGAIVLGKGNMPDLAIRWNTISSLHGVTRNPRDPGLTVGGSSGGEAAAVAAEMVPLGLGSDYGGSIRVPATWCGVLGFRPTTGLVAKAPEVVPLDFPPSYDLMASSGPLARSVEDLELAFEVLRGTSTQDPASVPVEPPPGMEPPGPVALLLEETGALLDPEVVEAVRATADALRSAGYAVEEGVVPDLSRAPELFAQIVGTELIETRLRAIRGQIGASALDHIESLYGQFSLGPKLDRYLAALQKRRGLARAVAAWMEDHPLVLCPVAGMTAPALDYDDFLPTEGTRELFDRMRCVLWVNLLGLPAVALGNGAQLVGRRFHDHDVLRAARAALPDQREEP
jgi:amidase